MSAQLRNALEQVNADLRTNLHPARRPRLLARRDRILRDLEETRQQERQLAARCAAIIKPVRYVPAYPTGEEEFRCAGCQQIIGRRGFCYPCARERELL